MPRYYVTLREVHTQGYVIEADNEEQAKYEAAERGNIIEETFQYSHCLESEHTTVEELQPQHDYFDRVE